MIGVLRVERNTQPFSTDSPFLFAVHHDDLYPAGDDKMKVNASLRGHRIGADFGHKDGWNMYHGEEGWPGFPKHPHRGFETISVTRHGFIDHTDSLGNAGRFGDGDVQWMTAGAGLNHAEMFPLLDGKENRMQMFQIWLNLPRASKMADPSFKMLWHEDIPKMTVDGCEVRLVAGQLEGFAMPPRPPPDSYASSTDAGVLIITLELQPGSKWTLPAASSEVARSIYVFTEGGLIVDGRQVAGDSRVVCRAESAVELSAPVAAGVLILQGKAIDEPVVQHGPFVGNTDEDIRKAMSDYRETQFGGWPWASDGVVHPREAQRFATFADTKTTEERPRASPVCQ